LADEVAIVFGFEDAGVTEGVGYVGEEFSFG
jgi:hypothetical protein